MIKLAVGTVAIIFVFYLAKITAKVANTKGCNPEHWFIAGILAPGVALVVAIFLEDQSAKECPRCIRRVDPTARICGFCGHDFVRDESVPQ